MQFKTSKTAPIMIIALILMSTAALHLQTKPANAIPSEQGTVIYIDPDNHTSTFYTPITSHSRWNFSIYIANVTDCQLVSVSLNSSDCTKAKIVHYYSGWLAQQSGWSPASTVGGPDPTTGYIDQLYTSTAGSLTITTPVEAFKVEVEVEGFAASVTFINITDSYVSNLSGDVVGGPGIVAPWPYGQAIYMNAIATQTITVDSTDYNVTTLSNSTISTMGIDQNQKALTFSATGSSNTTGYVNMTIPKVLLNANLTNWDVLVDSIPVTPTITENATHTFVYFNYSLYTSASQPQITRGIIIVGETVIPEFPSITMLLTLLATMTVALALVRKVHKKRWQTL